LALSALLIEDRVNAVEIEQAISALAEQPFDAQEFPFAFLQATLVGEVGL